MRIAKVLGLLILFIIVVLFVKSVSSNRVPIFEKVTFEEMTEEQKEQMLKSLISGSREPYKKYHKKLNFEFLRAFVTSTKNDNPFFITRYGLQEIVDFFDFAKISNVEEGIIEINGEYKNLKFSKDTLSYMFSFQYTGKDWKMIEANIE